jgi:hypothetical protein
LHPSSSSKRGFSLSWLEQYVSSDGIFYCEIQISFAMTYTFDLFTFFSFSLSIVYMPHLAILPFFLFLFVAPMWLLYCFVFLFIFHCVLCCSLFFSFSPIGFSNVYPRGAESAFCSPKSDSLPSPIIYPGRPIKLKTMRTEQDGTSINIETFVTWMFCNNTARTDPNPQRVLLLCCCITSVPVSQCISPAWPETIWHKKGEVYLY